MDPSSLPQTPSLSAPAHPGTGAAPNPDGTVTVQAVPAPPSAGPERTFTQADIEKARQEEKDKLYSRLNKGEERFSTLEAELATLRQEREERIKAEEAAQAAEAEAARSKTASEMSAKKLLEERSNEWEAKFAALQTERAQERETLAKEAEFNRLKAYAQERIGSERENIAPELLDYVSGNTQEEIDASIERAKAKTEQLFSAMQAAQQAARSQMRGVGVTGLTANGPTDSEGGARQLSADDIKNMSMAEYQKYRSQLLGAASNPNANRGLFD